MKNNYEHIRNGFGSVRPYVYGGIDLIEFITYTFEAGEIERYEFGPRSYQVTFKIGDSVLILEAGDPNEFPPNFELTRASVYVYVEDVDNTYRRAIKCGAESLEEPKVKPYDEKSASVRDTSGNVWYISTYKSR